MARISLGNFGEAVTQPVRERVVNQPGVDLTPVRNLLEDNAKIAKQEFERAREIDFQGKSEIAAANTANELDALNDEAQQRISKGEDAKAVEDDYELRSGRLTASVADQFQGEQRARFAPSVEKMRIGGKAKFRDMSAKIMSARTLDNLRQMLEAVSVSAIKDPDGAMMRADLAGESAIQNGADPLQVANKVRESKHSYRFDNLAGQIQQSSSNAELAKLRTSLLEGEGAGLDNSQRRTLANQAEARINQREAQARQAKAQIDAEMRAKALDIVAVIGSGLPQSIEFQRETASMIQAGGVFGEAVKMAQENAASLTQLAALPFDKQRETLEAERLKVSTIADADDAANQVQRVKILETAAARNQEQFKKAPLAYAAKSAGVELPPFDLSNPQVSIRARIGYAQFASEKFGKTVAILDPAEAESMANAMKALPAAERVKIARNIASVQDEVASAEPYITATFAEFGKVSPALAQEGLFSARKRVYDGQDVGLMIGRGQDAINPPDGGQARYTMASGELGAKKFNSEFSTRFDDLFIGNPAARQQAVEGMQAVYADIATRTPGLLGGTYDKDAFNQASSAYFGSKEPAEINDGIVLPPYGMESDAFVKKLQQSIRTTLTGNSNYSPQQIEVFARKATPRNMAGGYSLTVGDREVKLKDGSTAIIRVQP